MDFPSPSSPRSATLAVVTGAAAGIGAALTSALLDRGHDVVAIDLDVRHIDPRARRFAADVRDEAAMAAVAERFRYRAVTCVMANAGIGGIAGDAPTLPDEAWRWAWEVNTLGALRTLRLWWPHLRAGRGRAVATLSSAALQTFPGAGPYRASKAALLAALEGLQWSARADGISVHALCPGMVRTGITDVGRYAEAGRAGVRTSAETAGPDADNPFVAYIRQAMRSAETPEAFAARVLDELEAGPPFYWLTHADTQDGVRLRHRDIERDLELLAITGGAA